MLKTTQNNLTALQIEVLTLLGSGHTLHEVAALLDVDYEVVRSRLNGSYPKLGVHSREHALSAFLGLPISELKPTPKRVILPRSPQRSWTDTGLDCIRLGQDCGACAIYKVYGLHKNGDWASMCHQPESNRELMRKGILPPKSGISTGMTVPGRLRKKG